EFLVWPSYPAKIRGSEVSRAVVEAGARRGVLTRIRLVRPDGVLESPGDFMVSIAEDAHRAGLSEEHVIMLKLEHVRVVFPDVEVDGENVGMLRGGHPAEPQNPVVPIQLSRATPRVSARISREIPGGVRHERHVEKCLTWIPRNVVPVEDIEEG